MNPVSSSNFRFLKDGGAVIGTNSDILVKETSVLKSPAKSSVFKHASWRERMFSVEGDGDDGGVKNTSMSSSVSRLRKVL